MIKKGEYIRIYGIIGKVQSINLDNSEKNYFEDTGVYIDNPLHYKLEMGKDAIKSLKGYSDIIHLIEIGDYVNGGRVCDIVEDENDKIWIYTDSNYKYGILSDEIEDIMTKEQFDKMKYKVH